jgi:AcrR family transcriptional regulator
MQKREQNSTESTGLLAPEQTAVIGAILGGMTVTDAAKRAGVDRTTIYVWLKSDTHFQAELNRAKQEQVDAMRAQIRGLVDTAFSTLREMLTGPNVPAGVRLKAAITVLQSAGSLEPDDIGKTDAFAIDLDSMLGSGLLR